MKSISFNQVLLAQTPTQNVQSTGNQLLASLKSQSGLTLLACLAAVVAFQVIRGGAKKGKIATSYWGGGKQKC